MASYKTLRALRFPEEAIRKATSELPEAETTVAVATLAWPADKPFPDGALAAFDALAKKLGAPVSRENYGDLTVRTRRSEAAVREAALQHLRYDEGYLPLRATVAFEQGIDLEAE